MPKLYMARLQILHLRELPSEAANARAPEETTSALNPPPHPAPNSAAHLKGQTRHSEKVR